jgi:hypothetical protein
MVPCTQVSSDLQKQREDFFCLFLGVITRICGFSRICTHNSSHLPGKNLFSQPVLVMGWQQIILLAIVSIAFEQLCDLKDNISALQLPSRGSDGWTYICVLGRFSSHRAYPFHQGSHPASSPLFKWMWAYKAHNKHKFFFWLFLRDRINTRNLLHMKNIFLPSYICVLCVQNVEEDIRHLFFGYHFSDACWTYLGWKRKKGEGSLPKTE